MKKAAILFFFIVFAAGSILAQTPSLKVHYTISFDSAAKNKMHVNMMMEGVKPGELTFKMPQWMPGYYQIMNYANNVSDLVIKDEKNKIFPYKNSSINSWTFKNSSSKKIIISYNIKATKKFVANNYVDTSRAYIIPCATFLYPENNLQPETTVQILLAKNWSNIATGLSLLSATTHTYKASNYDMLFDSPILIGNLEELQPFYINGIQHRFIGYNLGNFDKVKFIQDLSKVVKAGIDIVGDIPYKDYTFIGIGPGRGGIEHLNNSTVSFDGKGLETEGGLNKTMSFLAHEFFHNYNVKRIRPYELGPFNYDAGSKTNLLWVSEGLSVYYEYLMVKRAGIMTEKALLESFDRNITTFENGPGKYHQSLTQSSYFTWQDGPFGTAGPDKNKSISYYEKGPVVGLLLDFAIRHKTNNQKSLDDVMRLVYREYYQTKNRGFTDAEFQMACEQIAGTSLNEVFEYVYTAKPLDYATYLGYGGLSLKVSDDKKYYLVPLSNMDTLQSVIYDSWLH
jgi:predicted metalloprotease with PDZ domain